jgi:hemerythrin
MKAYIDFHFTKEEELMQKFEYPEYMKHKAEHEFFVKKVLEIDAKYRKGQLVLSFEITDFLKNWFKNHILVSDKNYTTFFIARGVK